MEPQQPQQKPNYQVPLIPPFGDPESNRKSKEILDEVINIIT